MKGPAHPLACFGRFRAVSGRFRDVVRAAGGGPEAKFPPMANIDVGASPETRWGPSVLRFLLFSTLTIYMSAARRPLSHLSIGLFCAIGFSILADRRPILGAQRGARREELALQEYRSWNTPRHAPTRRVFATTRTSGKTLPSRAHPQDDGRS